MQKHRLVIESNNLWDNIRHTFWWINCIQYFFIVIFKRNNTKVVFLKVIKMLKKMHPDTVCELISIVIWIIVIGTINYFFNLSSFELGLWIIIAFALLTYQSLDNTERRIKNETNY
mgnify:CR=1 FL=1